MKKTILRAMVFGALLISPMFVVSCSDDYNDSEVRSMISGTQTDITSLEAKLEALTSAQAALPTAADVETAKNAAIAAAKTASDGAIDVAVQAAIDDAFAADAAQLVIVQGLISDLKTELEAAIAANGAAIDANGNAIAAANVRIDGLDARMQIVEDNISALQDFVTATNLALTQNAAGIAANTNLIKAAQDLADANAVLISDLQHNVANNADSIAANQARIMANTNLLANYKLMIDANKALIENNAAGILANAIAISDLQGGLTTAKAAIAALQTAVTDLQTALADAIYELNGKIIKILTNLSVANSERDTRVWISTMKVVNGTDFGGFNYPYETGDLFDSLKTEYGNDLLVVANPSTIDLDAYTFTLRNSQEEVPGVKLIPSSYNGLLTRADNNIISFKAEIDTLLFHVFLRKSFNMVGPSAPVRYAVQAMGMDMDISRAIVSEYRYILIPSIIDYDLADYVVRYPKDENDVYIPDVTPFGAEFYQGIMPAANVYKQYITLVPNQTINGKTPNAADFIGLGPVIDGNDSLKVSCTNKYAYNHQPIQFMVHYLYPDGSRIDNITSLTFGELEFADVTLNLDAYIDPDKAYDAQSSDTIALTDLWASVVDVDNWMAKATQVKVEAFSPNTDKDMPFIGTSFNSYDATEGTVMMTPPTTMASFTTKLRTLFITFDASEITEVGTYGSLFTFYDVNGELVNKVYVYLNVKGMLAFAAPKKVTAVWNAPTLDLNTVWLQTNSSISSVSYKMTKSYSEPITYMTFVDKSELDTLGFTSQSVTTPLTTVMADQKDCTFAVRSTLPIFGTEATTWVLTDDFSMKFRSAVAEANPNTIWDADASNHSLRYENEGEFTVSSIDAVDPSNNADVIHYLGDIPTVAGIAAGLRDYRIAKVDFEVVDPEATQSSNNLGMVTIKKGDGSALTPNADGSFTISSTMNSTVTSLKIAAIPDVNNEYPAVDGDVTLNLRLTVTDVFGFVKVVTLPFKVLSAEL